LYLHLLIHRARQGEKEAIDLQGKQVANTDCDHRQQNAACRWPDGERHGRTKDQVTTGGVT